jgi:1-phosphofructokinase family hexose kinase
VTAEGWRVGGRVLCVAPAPAIDRFLVVERLALGEIHRPLEVISVPGGKGLNVARAAAHLGISVTALAMTGGHAGRWISERLHDEEIELISVATSRETRTCISILSRQGAELTELYPAAEHVSRSEWLDFERAFESALGRGFDIVTISGSIPSGGPANGVARLVERAHRHNVDAIVDTHGSTLAACLPAGPAFVKVNASEAAEVVGGKLSGQHNVAAAAATLRERGARAAIITRGREGAIAVSAQQTLVVGPPPRLGPYSVGSGDAFTAGLAVALADGRDIEAALRLATGAAAANALAPGPGVLDGSLAQQLSPEVTVEPMAVQAPPSPGATAGDRHHTDSP